MNKKTISCIACKGKGVVPRPKRSKVSEKQKQEVLKLYRRGVGYREIARQTKIPHPQSVKHIIIYSNKV